MTRTELEQNDSHNFWEILVEGYQEYEKIKTMKEIMKSENDMGLYR